MSTEKGTKVDVTVLPDGEKTNVVIRHGEALPLREPKAIAISGDITTVRKFIEKRLPAFSEQEPANNTQLQTVFTNRSIVVVDKEAMTIELLLDPESPYGGKVLGSLLLTEDIKNFGINTNKVYSREDVVKLLRFNKRFFSSSEVYAELMKAFSAFTGNVRVKSTESSDNRANRDIALKVISESNIPTTFVLSIPVFKGVPALSFVTEICYDYSDSSFIFWFESPELKEQIEAQKEQIFINELEACKDLVIVNK